MNIDIFKDNFLLLYMLFVVSVFSIEKFGEKQKIAITYICTYGMTFQDNISDWQVVLLLCIVLFLMQEYFTSDKMKLAILKKIHYKLADYIYKGIFQYKLWGVILAICIKTDYFVEMTKVNSSVLKVVSVIIFVGTYVWLFNVHEEFHTFTHMFEKIWETPYYMIQYDYALKERLNIIVRCEDKLYFRREKSYSSFSLEFIKVWMKDYKSKHAGNRKKNYNSKNLMLMLRIFTHKIKRIGPFIKKWGTYAKNYLTRGNSTIAMQLVRILSYKHGLVFMYSKVRFKRYKILKRKIYEVLYCRMFFEGLKDYIKLDLCNELDNYREYLVYIYPYVVQTKVRGVTYMPASKYFAEVKGFIPPVNAWNIHKVIRMSFGFNGKAITSERLKSKADIVGQYEFKE